MAKKGRKQNKKAPVAAEDDNPVAKENEEPVANGGSTETPAKATKRASTAQPETSAKKKKSAKDEVNGEASGTRTPNKRNAKPSGSPAAASGRPKRAANAKAAAENKVLLAKKKSPNRKYTPRKAPSQYEVESIMDSRTRKGKTEFKIRWKGYSAGSDTWEPEKNLNCPEILEAYKNEKAEQKAE